MRAAAGAIWPCLALALGAFVVADGAARAEVSSLASHRAVYKLALASGTVANGIAALSGRLAIEIVDVCDGWTLDQRIGLKIVSPGGPEFGSFTSFTSWEAKDGTQFRFEQETKTFRFDQGSNRNRVTVEELSGKAELEPGKAGVARLTKPREIELPLPAGTLFPSRHTALLIDRALAGEKHFLGVVFDGSTLDNPNQVSVFIGEPETLPGLVDGADPQTAWPIRVAFFNLKRKTPEPDIEIGLILQADGVAREVDLDYQGFSIHGALESYEPLTPPNC